MRRSFLIILMGILVHPLFAQPSGSSSNFEGAALPKVGTMRGKIIDSNSKNPLEYANIAIYNLPDSTLAGGGIADVNGEFLITSLTPGVYFVDAKFIGYEHTKFDNVKISRESGNVNLGTIALSPASENISEVEVVAQDRPISYQIDKKIIDPAQFPAAANGTAADVLAQTPSVVVDIEGNVTLRGSSNFTVLIDGRPTPFDAADALAQIPASTIRNIEVITNPSAKYDPDGNSGIININTKKSKMTGISGIINASTDSYGSLSGDFLLNFKKDKFNFFLSANKADRRGGGNMESLNKTFANGDTVTTTSIGENERNFNSWSVKTGFDYYLNEKNTFTFNVGMNGQNRNMGGINDFHEFSTLGYDLQSVTESSSKGDEKSVSLSLDYKKTFDKAGQELTANIFYETERGLEYSYFDQFNGLDSLISGQKNWENGDESEFRFKTDYVHPITDKMKIETGYQLRADRSFEWNDVHWYTIADSYEASTTSPYYTESNFSRDIHSIYGTFSNSGKVFGYQLGLRGEYTDRSIDYSGNDSIYKINRFDLFPTAHFSFQLPWDQQLTTSYTRRIQRPRGFFLEPFKTYMDAYNVRVGNPGILPEYIDSYELGYQKQLKGGFASAELYHRKTNNKIEQIQSVYEGNVMLQSVDNIGADFSTGLELMVNLRPTKWWMFNIMGNAYHYSVEGIIAERDISSQSFNWNARFSNTFNLTKTTKFQLDGMYNSPTTSAQGKREGFMFTNLAVRQDLLDNKLNVTFSVRDILNTAKFGFESSGPNFYSKRKMDMKSPVFALTLSYKINNYRQNKNSNPAEGEGEGSMDMGGGF